MQQNGELNIIVAERGWIFIGFVRREGEFLIIQNCDNIRRWGTKRGLGQLAIEGPQSETALDFYGTVKIHVLAICFHLECDEEVWKEHFSKREVPRASDMSQNGRLHIVVAERGWIFNGFVSREGELIVIRNCDNIRRWGTQRGLGQLALEGPQPETTLDFYGTAKIHVLAICFQLECNEDVWKAHFAKRAA